MDLLVALLCFIFCMAVSLVLDITMLMPFGIGFILLSILAVRRGYLLREVMRFAAESLRDSFIVVEILLIIGCLTGMWRMSGTVAYFVSLGVSVIPPQVFVLSAFLLSAVMSYALGTSFGVTATAGVILMSIANAGGVNPVLAAGAIYSGVYVGDRGSPAASSGNLVAVLTHTDMRKNVRYMLRCSLVPFLLCCLIYGVISLRAPMQSVDTDILKTLGEEFALRWYCIIPAVLMIILPFCRLGIKLSMAVSLAASFAVAVFVQHESVLSCLKAMIFGFTAKNTALAAVLSGGGAVSMLEICAILIISCSFGSIFEGTHMISAVKDRVRTSAEKIGRFPMMLVIGAAVSALFCNQTIAAIMQSNLSDELYGDDEKSEKMIDMENSVILEAGLVPWCIASSVPLAMLGVDARAILTGFYLWLVPVWWLVRRKMQSKKRKSPEV